MNILSNVREKSIENYAKHHDLKGKKVVLRIDVNTSLGDNLSVDPGEDWRILKSLNTIRFLVEHEASVVLISHIGRDPHASLKPVHEYMQNHLQLGFIPSYDDELIENTLTHMQHGSVVMIENLRSNEGEKANNADFLNSIVSHCDLYVNDAFSVSHRKHASVHAITKELPSYFGLQFIDELDNLSRALESKGITTLVLGGAKFGTKLDLLEKMLPKVSYVLLGGALANVFLRERGFEIGASFADTVDISSMVHDKNIILPVDCVDQDGDLVSVDQVGKEDMILDIGHETEELFEQVIAHSDLVLWNGPMGKYEDGYTSGSLSIAKSLSHSDAFSVTGGGDTATVILEQDVQDSVDFISTGGGAMLDYLVDGSLPGIDVIINSS